MRKLSNVILSLLIAFILVYAVVPAYAFDNLLQNPGFETGEFDPWEADSEGEDAGAGIYSPPSHTGTYSAGFGAGDGWAWIWQDIDPPRCARYLEFWYNGDHGQVIIRYSDGTTHTENLPNSVTWSKVHINLNPYKLVEYVETGAGDYDGIYVDDFDLEACEAGVVGGELVSSPLLNEALLIVVIAAASIITLSYRFTRGRSSPFFFLSCR